MLFSIIIPTYNRAQLIKRTLESILTQKFQSFEVIIVDDGSIDNTEEVVASINDSRIRYYKKNNEERGIARNFGAKLSKGRFLNFFDSDDIMLPNHLEEAEAFLKNVPQAQWFAFSYKFVDSKLKDLSVYNIANEKGINLISGNFLACNPTFIERETFLKYKFNESRALSALEDWELWLRCSMELDLFVSPIITNLYVNHDSRSVLDTNIKALISRVNCLISLVENNPNLSKFYSDKINVFYCSCYSYIALHTALTGKEKMISIRYLFKSLKYNIGFLKQRRFYAIIKHLLIK